MAKSVRAALVFRGRAGLSSVVGARIARPSARTALQTWVGPVSTANDMYYAFITIRTILIILIAVPALQIIVLIVPKLSYV